MKRARFSIALAVSLSLSSRTRAETTSKLTVNVSTLRSARGALVCRLFAGPDGFPSKATFRAQVRVPVSGATTSCTFEQLPPGTYAVGVFHDENGNGKLDTNFLGIPSEGVGVSNDKRPLIGPPSFSDAKFRLSSTEKWSSRVSAKRHGLGASERRGPNPSSKPRRAR